jgi:hypothetical protein
MKAVLVSLFLLATDVRADVDHNAEIWAPVIVQGFAGERLRYLMEVQPRASSLTGLALQKIIVRPAVGYQMSKTFSLWLGYAWIPFFAPERVTENRVFQQMLFEVHPLRGNPHGDFLLVNRTRFEERFIDDASGPSFRLRHMARGVYRIPGAGGLGVAASDELFVNLVRLQKGPPDGFDQNRAYVGFNYKIDALQLELGYLNDIVNRGDDKPWRMAHVLITSVVWNAPTL